MKKIMFILTLFAGILFSCKKDATNITLGIDVQSSFNNDNVQILIDGQQLINKPLQTNYSLGLCPVDGQITLTQNNGHHELKVIVNNSTSKIESFSLNKPLYIGINYDQTSQNISFVYSQVRFIYD